MARVRMGTFLKVIDKVARLTAVLFLLISSSNASRLYAQANPYEGYRPTREEEEVGFEELQAINPDVFGWINIFGTNIDYPLVQDGGGDNRRYEHINARGEPSMAGAIFLDVRNNSQLTDFNNIIYGHDMTRAAMFGEISHFTEEAIFNEHRYGMIFTGERYYGIELFALLLVDAHDFGIYNPNMEDPADKEAFIERLFTEALQSREMDITVDDRLVVLSTCTPTATNGRHILVGRLAEEVPEDPFGGARRGGYGIGNLFGIGELGLVTGSLLVIFVVIGITLLVVKQKKKSTASEEGAEENKSPKKKKKTPTILEEVLFLTGKIAVVLIILTLLFIFVFGATQVNDASMAPAVQEGDIVFFQRVGRDFAVNDAIVVRYDGQTQVRRIVAVAGDTVDITYDGLVINSLLQQELHIFEETTQFLEGITFPLIVPEGEVFVLGDSRIRARDSRMYGTIQVEDVLGRVVTVIRRRNL